MGKIRAAAGCLCASVALLFGVLGGMPVWAADIPQPTPVCTVKDSRLAELSGLVSDGTNWYAINDGGTKIEIFVLGRDCAVKKVITNKTDPYDVEDLARTADGTLWLSDTGDNRKQRDTVALHAVKPNGQSTLYRLTYPDGQHDTEALIMDRAGVPFLITKDIFGNAGIYRPAGKLAANESTVLEKAGSVKLKSTDTPGGPVGGIGSTLVTGAALSADGTVVALRTYTDAYLFSAPDGDVLAALGRSPVRIPLPNEKQGEALAFEPDGTLLSGSEGVGESIRAIPDAVALVVPATEGTAGPGAPELSNSPRTVVPIVLVVGAVGGVLIWFFRRSRRKSQ